MALLPSFLYRIPETPFTGAYMFCTSLLVACSLYRYVTLFVLGMASEIEGQRGTVRILLQAGLPRVQWMHWNATVSRKNLIPKGTNSMLSNEVNVARLDIVRLNFDSTTRRSASSLQNFSYDISLSRKIQSIRTTKSMFHSFSSFLFSSSASSSIRFSFLRWV